MENEERKIIFLKMRARKHGSIARTLIERRMRYLIESTSLELRRENCVEYAVENELDLLRVRGAGEVGVDGLLTIIVGGHELSFDILGRFVVVLTT